jgi:23S rRNA (cytidine1920-2'-O)/16S rRNA (cytidine1409-2'-O)-methyltransferase
MKIRLDQAMVARGFTMTRSQAENYIRLGRVKIRPLTDAAWRVVTKPGFWLDETAEIKLDQDEQFVSRAALKLKSVAEILRLDFRDKTVLDIGSSTGGFTQFAITRGARKVIAVDVGTQQLAPILRKDPQFSRKIELHEKTDIRDLYYQKLTTSFAGLAGESRQKLREDSRSKSANDQAVYIHEIPDLVLADVSFISLREILPHIATNLADKNTQIVVMAKPQFEAGFSDGTTQKSSRQIAEKNLTRGIVKNEKIRRQILTNFETFAKNHGFLIQNKRDSDVAGAHGNRERFYLLKSTKS